jgi:hypothetical protein
MFISRVKVQGFKSFGDATEVSFLPGLNVIVGKSTGTPDVERPCLVWLRLVFNLISH